MKKLVLVVLVMSIGIVSIAQPGNGPRRGQGEGIPPKERKEMMAEKLGLSDDQKEQIEFIRKDFKGEIQGLKNQLDIKHAELKAAIADEVSRKKIDAYVNEINTLNNESFKKEIDHMLKVRALLDDDQKVIFDSMRHKMGRKHGGMRGRRN